MKINCLEVLKEKEKFEWIPILACHNSEETKQMQVEYNIQNGKGCKIKIEEGFSLVFIVFSISCVISALSDGDNYAKISGLPYAATDYGSVSFGQFSFGINITKDAPLGMFSSQSIYIKTQRGGMDRWVAYPNDKCIIYGSGFYFTNE